ncbi:MAG: sulfotransferase [Planctomycetaceae bacterium]|nr:sulfotransferase [Planctomycetaceae bacterium]
MAGKSTPKHSSQGPLTIWHGMDLPTMVRFFARRPAIHVSRLHRILSLPLFATYNTVMKGVESLLYGRQIMATEIRQPPIFILGYWRSGTTLLHNLVTSDPRFTHPTLYQTVFPWHFLSTYRINSWLTAWMVPKTRPMDNVKVSWDAPQEDDVALCSMSLVSPYTLLAWPNDLEGWKVSHEMDGLPEAERKRWEQALLHLMRKITVKDPRPIVLKSPSHTYRVKQLVRMFPEAKFIYIYRNPYDVIRSSIHLRRTMMEENCLGRAVHPHIEDDVIQSYLQAFDSYQNHKHLIPQGNLSEVQYESLAADPLAELQRIYCELNLSKFDSLSEILSPQIPELKRYRKNRFEYDIDLLRQVCMACERVYDHFGYPITSEAADRPDASSPPSSLATGAA